MKTFAALVLNRFAQEHHELLLRQLFQIHQTATVAEYIDQFLAIVDQLGAYNRTTDPMFYTMRFIDGLQEHICAVVALHRPQTWDTACVLSQLQEDLTSSSKSTVRKWDVTVGAKPFTRAAYPIPPPPPRVDKLPAPPELKPPPGRVLTANDHWAALRATRKAQGLCYKCGAKWSRDHKCPAAVQLHVLEEMLELFSVEDSSSPTNWTPDDEQAQLAMLLSATAVSGITAPRTMSFEGMLGDTPLRIVLDSGSTHTFLSASVAAQSPVLSPLPVPLRVQVANGQYLTCSQFVSSAKW